MIQSILEQKMALAAYAAENDIPQLTANQLEIARKLTLVLAPIEEITQAISKQTATLSMVVPFIRVLLRSWEKEDDDRGIQTMKEQMIHSLNSRFAGIEDNHLLSVVTLTDPRFKNRFFASNIVKASAKDMLQEELRKESPSENSVDNVDRTKAPSPKRHK